MIYNLVHEVGDMHRAVHGDDIPSPSVSNKKISFQRTRFFGGVTAGIRLWRRYPLPASGERAPRPSEGVCEPDFASRCSQNPVQRRSDTSKHTKKRTLRVRCVWRRHPDLNWGIEVLQTFALPLGYDAVFICA